MIKLLFSILFFGSLGAVQIEIGGQVLDVEIADTAEKQAKGLSGRTGLPDGTGMLFVYKKAQITHFWMKDTLIPLAIGFFDNEHTLIDWQEMQVPEAGKKNIPLYSCFKPVLFALEVPQGWFANHKIERGTKLKILNIKNPSQDPIDSVK